MSKFRIKEIGLSNGKTLYIPQQKFLFWWFDFLIDRRTVTFDGITHARQFLDKRRKPYTYIHRYP